MAQVLLTAVGTAVGGPLGGAIGGVLGGLADRALVSSLATPRQAGGRLSGLELHSTSVGAPMPAVFGRARVAGQTIWAARFREQRVEQRSGGGKSSGPKTVSYSYSLSFAVGLCEGPIDGIGRIWADGQVMDVSAVQMRVHLGGPDQAPDPLIEAVEGRAPAFRNTAYLVFEDLPLDRWGNRPPQLNVEIFRRPVEEGLESRLRSINLIPGAGEFVLQPTVELRETNDAVFANENVHNAQGRPDLLVALDALQAQLPHVEHVNLVVTWFGTDLRAGVCEVRPGVERLDKVTTPSSWRVEVGREGAHVVSEALGGPAFGGTPSDATVLHCIAELRRRGLGVTLYPFLMMDVPAANSLPDPYGGPRQAPYPWRGRITGEAAPGRPGATDLTPAAAAQVARFFGACAPEHFAASGEGIAYAGPVEWSYRRLVLHYARLLTMAGGGVEGILIGSELRGLTTLRSAPGVYPAVGELARLAADVKAVVGPEVKVGYAGDWSEWFGHQPADGTGEVRFHLDPLWAHPAIDFVGVDFYPPLADWRRDDGGVDAAAGARGPYDVGYLSANVLGGEDFAWFYASDAARAAQARTPVTDGAYGEPWVFRGPKDLRAWWANPHHDRPGGVRASTPTAWTPGMKPIRLVEFGCPAVDRGSNAPNLFIDPKSSESALPPASTGVRDDLAQRRALEAVLAVYQDPANNPASPVDGRAMLELDRMSAWCWDARPYPDFPARRDVWKDAPNWTLGHWLNGRVGASDGGGDIVSALLRRAGLAPGDFRIEGPIASAYGYVVPGPMSTAEALQPLAEALGFDLAEREGRVAVVGRGAAPALSLGEGDLARVEDAAAALSAARTLEPAPDAVRVRYLDEADAYQAGSVVRRAARPGPGGTQTADLPVVLDAAGARQAADARLQRAEAEQDALTLHVSPLAALRVEPGDVVEVEGAPGAWRVVRAEQEEHPRLHLVRAGPTPARTADPVDDGPPAAPVPAPAGPPRLLLIDAPALEGAEEDARPLAALAVEPWRAFDVHAGPTAPALTLRGRAEEPATLGVTLSALPPGPRHRWDEATALVVRPAAGALLASAGEAEVRAGANTLAIRAPAGGWEVLQFRDAEPLGDGSWRLTRLLRAQLGTEDAMTGAPAGAPWMRLGRSLARLHVGASERGLELLWRAATAGGPPGGPGVADASFTWRARAWRPWSPAHLRAARMPGGLRLTWVRRARAGGDAWDGEVPLTEGGERYRVEVLSGPAVGTYETRQPRLELAPMDLGAAPYTLTVHVRQWSDRFGDWGAATERTLWL